MDGTYPRISQRIRKRFIYVKLAEENAPAEQSDSDSSAYGSINDAVTGEFPHVHETKNQKMLDKREIIYRVFEIVY